MQRDGLSRTPAFAPRADSTRSACTSSADVVESRPDVGSSRNKRDGSATISMATFTRLRWPPEMPRFSASPITEFSMCSRPNVASVRSVCLRTAQAL